MGGSKAGAAKRLKNQQANGTDKFSEYGAKGGAKSLGRKLSKEHKRRISEAQKARLAKEPI